MKYILNIFTTVVQGCKAVKVGHTAPVPTDAVVTVRVIFCVPLPQVTEQDV